MVLSRGTTKASLPHSLFPNETRLCENPNKRRRRRMLAKKPEKSSRIGILSEIRDEAQQEQKQHF